MKPEVMRARLRPIFVIAPLAVLVAVMSTSLAFRIYHLATWERPEPAMANGMTICADGFAHALNPDGTWGCTLNGTSHTFVPSSFLPAGSTFTLGNSGDLTVSGRLFVRGVEVCNATDTRVFNMDGTLRECLPARPHR